jgi:aspartate aminotransferase-like enzyme
MTPGPTNVPKRVLNKMNELVFHHRTKEFGRVFEEFNERLKFIFQTNNTVLTFPAAGTGGLEATIVNMFSKKDKILAVSVGVFGDRFIEIGKTFDLDIEVINIPWGKGVEIEEIKSKLREDHKALIVTHNETSTGAVNDIKKIGEFMKDKNQLYIVDAVSSLGGIEIQMDNWNIDVLISASQKALMSPPGLTFVGVNEKAWGFAESSNISKYYFDFKKAKKYMEKEIAQTPYTPAVSLILGTNESLKIIEEEGLYNVYKRHEKLATRFRDGVKKLGLDLFVDKKYYSNTITSIKLQNKADKLKDIMEDEFNIVIAGGQGILKDKIIRVGHMGCVSEEMINLTLDSMKKSLEKIY